MISLKEFIDLLELGIPYRIFSIDSHGIVNESTLSASAKCKVVRFKIVNQEVRITVKNTK